MTNLKVIVRVRPLSKRETDTGSIPIIEVGNKNIVAITNVKVPEQNAGDSRQRIRRFTFDYCFDENSTQDDLFQAVENVIGKAIKRRYHSCVLAYGQSASGKTHTMMGFPHDPGLAPRLSKSIFQYLQESAVGDEIANMKTTVSYLEIYNEKVRDLLSIDKHVSEKNSRTLKIREHPKKGPYVQGLTEHPVKDQVDLLSCLRVGNSNRRVAATLNNTHSSRSHSVITVTCDGVKLYLVDLAGSERAGHKLYTTCRFREGANINKSLVALGNVISALSEQPAPKSKGIRRRFIPFRDSVLTWLLKETLGGNSNTVMIATVSPSSSCYSETVNTFRFGQRAKLIVSCPVVNEDPNVRIIRELRAEIAKLRQLLQFNQNPSSETFAASDLMPSGETPTFDLKRDDSISTESLSTGRINDTYTISDASNSSTPVPEDEIYNSCGNVSYTEISRQQSDNNGPSHGNENNGAVGYVSVEKLIPVMDVRTKVSVEKRQIPKVRRTASVDFGADMDKPQATPFGSAEAIASTSRIRKIVGSSSDLLRRRSSIKTATPLKSFLLKKPPAIANKKLDKGVETEARSPLKIESKVDSYRKNVPKQRSEIVAAVTHRLYAKTKRKEVATDMEGFHTYEKDDTPKELTICSNARLRLKELTQRALKAHRNRHVETQTDSTPVLRLKETATDSQDLKNALMEVKNVETCTGVILMVDASVSCQFVDNFKDTTAKNTLVVTKSCGTQATTSDPLPENLPKREASPSRVSFTKYLQPANFEFSNPYTSNPIYTNSVNINISHHYLNGKTADSVSDDSLDDQTQQNVCFPTPDLISNHNSLEPHTHAVQTASEHTRSDQVAERKLAYGNYDLSAEDYFICDEFLPQTAPIMVAASCALSPEVEERIESVGITSTYLPEICSLMNVGYQRCVPFWTSQPNYAKCRLVEAKEYQCDDCVKLQEPLVLKSIIKILPSPIILDHFSTEPELDRASSHAEIPDSLEYHVANIKKVHFAKPEKNKQNDKMFKAMSTFLEEASNLMSNISAATKNSERHHRLPDMNDFDLEVTVNKVSGLDDFIRESRRASPPRHNVRTQTERYDGGAVQEPHVLTNKFDKLLESTCKRIEEKIDSISTRPSTFRPHNSVTSDVHSTGQYVYNPWDLRASSYTHEESSIESNPITFSDYGSLPRQTRNGRRHRTATCSPSAFLKQLTNMRKHVIESSREDLSSDS